MRNLVLRRAFVPFVGIVLVFAVFPEAKAAPAGHGVPQGQQTVTGIRGNVSGFAGYLAGMGDGLGNDVTFGASGAVFFTDIVGVEGGVQKQSLDVAGTSENQLSGGTIDSIVITAGVIARFEAGPRAAPYVAGGIVFFSNSFELDAAVAQELSTFNFTAQETVANVVGFNVGGGVEFLVARRVAVFGDVRYFAAKADTSAVLSGSGVTAVPLTGEQDLARVSATAGIRLGF